MIRRQAIKDGYKLMGKILLEMDFNDVDRVETYLNSFTPEQMTAVIEFCDYCKQLRKVFK